MLNFALYSMPRGGKNTPFISPALKTPILIRNDSLTSDEFQGKTVVKYLICRTSYEYLKQG